jgi:uncharacterized protein (TIGR02246 family)
MGLVGWCSVGQADEKYEYLTADRLSDADEQAIKAVRRAVWEAWFRGDGEKIRELMPPETIAADPHDATWIGRDQIIQRSKDFAKTGSKLVELNFPMNRIQVYGGMVVMYVNYELSFDENGETGSMKGRGTEVFVLRDGRWLHSAWHLDAE